MFARIFLAVLVASMALGLAAASGAEPTRVALLPVVVHSSDPESGYLSKGIADMLSARLEQSGALGVVRMPDGVAATNDAATAVEAGRAAGAQWVVFGSFTQFGAGASLDMQCSPVDAEADLEPRRVFIQGTVAEIIPKLETLAEKVQRHVTGQGAPRRAAEVAAAEEAPDEPALRDELEDLRGRVEELERLVAVETAQAASGESGTTGEPGIDAAATPGASDLR